MAIDCKTKCSKALGVTFSNRFVAIIYFACLLFLVIVAMAISAAETRSRCTGIWKDGLASAGESCNELINGSDGIDDEAGPWELHVTQVDAQGNEQKGSIIKAWPTSNTGFRLLYLCIAVLLIGAIEYILIARKTTSSGMFISVLVGFVMAALAFSLMIMDSDQLRNSQIACDSFNSDMADLEEEYGLDTDSWKLRCSSQIFIALPFLNALLFFAWLWASCILRLVRKRSLSQQSSTGRTSRAQSTNVEVAPVPPKAAAINAI